LPRKEAEAGGTVECLAYHVRPLFTCLVLNPSLHSLKSAFDAIRSQLLVRDVARLERTLHQAREGKFDAVRFEHDVQRARLAAENRSRLRPEKIAYPEELPVAQAREQLLDAIRDHQVIVLCGETGSGKTTQLPKLCLELGRGSRGLIGHTQPRRLAARSVANRIARELNSTLGGLVGYETRFDRRVSEQSLIKLMTDGILLAELQRDHQLLAYDTIIIDEAHERSLNIDFLLGWFKRLLPQRPDLKLIITSATLDPERLAAQFNDAPILRVEGRGYPIEIRYREQQADEDLEDQVASAVDELWRGGRSVGDTLVFLPGEREIRDLSRSLPGRFPRAEVLPLYSRLPAQQQDKVFSSGGAPRIILSTNVAETSVTVPGIRYVVDTGTARVNRYSPRLGVQQLQIEAIAQSAANQRAGRCGRVGPGICVRLYAEDDFAARPPFTTPEILRSNLAGVILQMSALGLGEIDDFPWVDAPENRHVSEGYRVLQTLGALDDERRLTALGRDLARLPLDPRIARIAQAGRGTPCQDLIAVLAAALSVQDPHEVPPDAQEAARKKHLEWRHPRSDFLSLLNLWALWQQWSESASNRQLRKLCRDHFVSYLRMEEWESVHKQIADLLATKAAEAPRKTTLTLDELYPQIHKCLAAGLIDHIGQKLPEKPEFQGPRGRRFKVFPASALSKKPPQWLLSAQLAQTSQLFARTNAAVEPEWLAEVGAHLVKHTLTHPKWNPERGEVTATEHQSLFGLMLVKRQRHYGSLEPVEARKIFILEALVRGNWTNKLDFLQRNLALIETVRDKETKLRRPELLADEAQLFAFYDQRVPAEVCTVAGLKSWLRTNTNAPDAARGFRQFGAQLLMTESDVLRPGADADVAHLFPDHLQIGEHRVRLSYTHDPGADADGVSFHLPLAQIYALPENVFDWLVPGLRAARIEALIRSLPQNLRRYCTPATEYATALAERMQPHEGVFLIAICKHFHEMTGVTLRPEDFVPDKLPAHLKPRLLAEDTNGNIVAEAASLLQLQQRYAEPARAALTQAAAEDVESRQWVRASVTDWDFGDLPEFVALAKGLRAYPALAASEQVISLRLFESPAAAQASHPHGVRAILLSRLSDRLRDLSKTAKTKLNMVLVGAPYTADELARAVAERAAESAWDAASIRTQAQFNAALMQRGEFGREAVGLLEDVCGWLLVAADLRRKLKTFTGAWPESLKDMREQLDMLFSPGFVCAIPEEHWPRMTLYLKALAVRLERCANKPQRDAELTAQVQKLVTKLPNARHPAHWLLQEWRIALFSQELRALGSPNAEKISALIAAD
jgi:ATP-dependent helicase HrpA